MSANLIRAQNLTEQFSRTQTSKGEKHLSRHQFSLKQCSDKHTLCFRFQNRNTKRKKTALATPSSIAAPGEKRHQQHSWVHMEERDSLPQRQLLCWHICATLLAAPQNLVDT